jgi:uncharacterized protein YndB with AHSA1/START domain
MSTDSIARDVVIAAPPTRVWELLTTAEHLGTWFGDAGAAIELRPGGALELRWREHPSAHGRVEVVEPPERFTFRWAAFGDGRGAEPADGTTTLVEFTLAALDGGTATRLSVVESGFDALDLPADERRREHESHTEGWPREIDELRRLAEGVLA